MKYLYSYIEYIVTSCCFVLCYSKGNFDEFIRHLQGLTSIYSISGDKYVYTISQFLSFVLLSS